MKTIRSALLISSSHLAKILVGFLLLKLIALYLGAEGLGVLGHFMSAVTIVTLLAGGGVVNGVVKFVAEYRCQPRKMLFFISAAAFYSFAFCVAALVLGVVFSKAISIFLFGSDDFYWVVMILAVAQLGFAFINLVTGVCNGLGDTKSFAIIQVIGSLLALPLAWFLIVHYGVAGAAIAIVAVFFMGIFPALYLFFNSSFIGRITFTVVTRADLKKLSAFTVMLVASALTFPLVEMAVREFLIRNSGYVEAGLWQASIKLSAAYLGFFGVFLAYYFVPLISPVIDKKVIGQHVRRFMLLVMLIFLIGASVLYAGRVFFIPLLLSSDFLALESLIVYQLVGDFFKISAYVVGFVAVAKAATKLYVAAEIAQCVLFMLFGILFFQYYSGAKAVMIGYAFSCFSYFLISLVSFFFYARR